MRLKLLERHSNEIPQLLLDDFNFAKHANIEKVIESLQDQNKVFMLKPEEAMKIGGAMRKLLQTSLVQENVETTKLIKAFKDIIGEYTVLSKQQQIDYEKTIYKKYIKGKEDQLKAEFDIYISHNNTSLCSIDDIQKVMAKCGCKVLREHMDYIHWQMFIKADDIDNLDCYWLLEIFDHEAMGDNELQQEYMEQVNAIENDDRMQEE